VGTRLYLRNLPPRTEVEQLRALCERNGRSVESIRLICRRGTDTPRTIAFVDMSSVADASACATDLNGRRVRGRTIAVSETRAPTRSRG